MGFPADTSTAVVSPRRRDEFTRLRSLDAQKAWLAARKIPNPYFPVHEGIAGAHTVIDGQPLLNFSSYNYLGFNGDADVSAAAKAAIDRYGTTVSASRIVSGERPIHRELEQEIASFTGCEDALVFVSGHGTNVSVIGDLVGASDLVLHDATIHNSALLGIRLSGARRLAFAHNDWRELEALLVEHRASHPRVLILVEGVYSMDGDPAELKQVVALKHRHDALLMVDEAHSMGVLGATGRGAREHCGLSVDDADLWMGTLSKAFASCGGYVAGRHELVERLRYFTPGLMFSVGLPPSAAAAALTSIRKLRAEPQRARILRERAELFRELCHAYGWNIGPSADSAIVPVILGDSERALRLSASLRAAGLNVQPIVFPGVPHRHARLRFFFSCDHTEDDVRRSVEAINAALA